VRRALRAGGYADLGREQKAPAHGVRVLGAFAVRTVDEDVRADAWSASEEVKHRGPSREAGGSRGWPLKLDVNE
jgi:hypothetical protein